MRRVHRGGRVSSLRESCHAIVFEHDTTAGLAFDIAVLVLICVSVISTLLESVHSYYKVHKLTFKLVELVSTALFAAEYVLRLLVAQPGPLAYACSFFGAVDLCAILPALLEELLTPGSSSLRIVRVLRLLRVFRVVQLDARLAQEADALRSAFWASRRKVFVFLLSISLICTVMGTAEYIVEDNTHSEFTSIPRSIYWAIVTVTTVGYGDISPQSSAGQAIASMMMVCGYSIIAVPTGIFAAEYTFANARARGGGDGGARWGGASAAGTRRPQHRGAAETSLESAPTAYALCCARCEAGAHDDDAAFCKYCGSELVEEPQRY